MEAPWLGAASAVSYTSSDRSQSSSSHFGGFTHSDGVQSRHPTISGSGIDATAAQTPSVPSRGRRAGYCVPDGFSERDRSNKPKNQSQTINGPSRGNLGFQGRPVIKSSSFRRINGAAAKTSPANGSYGDTQSTGSRSFRNPLKTACDIRLLLAGDGLGRNLTSRSLGQGHFNRQSRSNTRITLGGAELSGGKAQTTLSKSALTHNKQCDACAVEFIRHWLSEKQQQQPEKQITLASAIDIAFKKTSSDVRAFYQPLQLIPGEQGKMKTNQIFAMMATTNKAKDYRLLKEPVNLHTVSLPKKGLIKLTGINYELSNPEYYDNRKETADRMEQDRLYHQALFGSALPPQPSELYRGLLIKNKTMIKQLKHGERRLAQVEDLEMSRLDGDVLDTLVQGLLQYQMPDVPNLNTIIQGFIGVKRPSPRLNRERITSPRPHPGTSETSQTVKQKAVSEAGE